MTVKKKVVDTIFVSAIGIIGVIFLIISFMNFGNINKKCYQPIIYNGMLGIMTIGGILVTISLVYYVCVHTGNRNCYTSDGLDEGSSRTYLVLGLFVTVILFGLLFTMLNALTSDLECSGTKSTSTYEELKNAKKLEASLWFLISISGASFVCTIWGLFYIYKIEPSQFHGGIKQYFMMRKKKKRH